MTASITPRAIGALVPKVAPKPSVSAAPPVVVEARFVQTMSAGSLTGGGELLSVEPFPLRSTVAGPRAALPRLTVVGIPAESRQRVSRCSRMLGIVDVRRPLVRGERRDKGIVLSRGVGVLAPIPTHCLRFGRGRADGECSERQLLPQPILARLLKCQRSQTTWVS